MRSALHTLQSFVWWAACTDEEAVALCSPVTRFYQTTVGMMILITAALAFVSGGYALHQVTRNLAVTLPLACLYALSIFCMDRFIVSARSSRMAWFRLPLALVIACVIAVPLELRLFEERIDQELRRAEREENNPVEDRRRSERDEFRDQIGRLENRADQYRQQISEWGQRMEAEVVGRVRAGSTGKAGEGAAYRAAADQRKLASDLLGQVTQELDRLRQREIETMGGIEAEYTRQRFTQSRDLLARYEALHAIERQHPQAAKMTWAISILLVLIELFPALSKLLLPYTAYAALVETREREDIQRTHSLGNHNLREIVARPSDGNLFVIKQTDRVQQASRSGAVKAHAANG